MSTIELIQQDHYALNKAELDTAITTAKSYPRDMSRFIKDCEESLKIPAFAERCVYTLEREDKKTKKVKIIQGKSIGLANIVFSFYGNLKAASRIKENDGKMIKVECAIIDMERNNMISVEQVRSICYSNGGTFSNDLIVTTANAAIAIAFRNAVFKIIPSPITDNFFEIAKKTIKGSPEQLADKIKKLLEDFEDAELNIVDYLRFVNIDKIEQITSNHLIGLRGVLNVAKDGFFEAPADKAPQKNKEIASALKAKADDTVKKMTKEEAEEWLDGN